MAMEVEVVVAMEGDIVMLDKEEETMDVVVVLEPCATAGLVDGVHMMVNIVEYLPLGITQTQPLPIKWVVVQMGFLPVTLPDRLGRRIWKKMRIN